MHFKEMEMELSAISHEIYYQNPECARKLDTPNAADQLTTKIEMSLPPSPSGKKRVFELVDANTLSQPIEEQGEVEVSTLPLREADTEPGNPNTFARIEKSAAPVRTQLSAVKCVALVALGFFALYAAGACLKGSLNPADWVSRLQYWSSRGRSYEVCERKSCWPFLENCADDKPCQSGKLPILDGSPLSLQPFGQKADGSWMCNVNTPENNSGIDNWLVHYKCMKQFPDFKIKYGNRLPSIERACYTNALYCKAAGLI